MLVMVKVRLGKGLPTTIVPKSFVLPLTTFVPVGCPTPISGAIAANIQTAPQLVVSAEPPTNTTPPSPESAMPVPCCAFPVAPEPMKLTPIGE